MTAIGRERSFYLMVQPPVGSPPFSESHASKSIWIAQTLLDGFKKEKKTKYWVGRKGWIDLGEMGEGRI